MTRHAIRNSIPIGFAVIVVVFTMTTCAVGQSPSVEDTERLALESRRRLQSGHCVFHVRWNVKDYQSTSGKELHRYEIWFKGSKYRMDHAQALEEGDQTKLLNQIIVTDDTVIRRSIGAAISNIETRDGRTVSNLELPDPRVLGFVSKGFHQLGNVGLQELVQRTERTEIDAAIDKVADRDAVLITYQIPGVNDRLAKCRLWFVPVLGYNVAKIEVNHHTTDYVGRYRLRNQLALFPDGEGESWYPQESHYSYEHNGRVKIDQSTKTIFSEFNRDIDDQVFSLNPADLKIGDAFIDGEGRLLMWDGKQLSKENVGDRVEHENNSARVNTALVLFNAAILIAGLGVVVLYFCLRRGRRSD